MKKRMLILFIILISMGCTDIDENSAGVEVSVTSSRVYNVGDTGAEVPDPSGLADATVSLTNAYFSFIFDVTNTSDDSVVLESFSVEVLNSLGTIVATKDFSPISYVANTSVGDASQRFFGHIDPGVTAQFGSVYPALFYIDGLEKDENTGSYSFEVRITLNGFVTNSILGEDPYLDDLGIFKRLVYVTVEN